MLHQNPVSIPINQIDTLRQHRRQRFWQILLPIILASGLMVVGLVWVILNAVGQPNLTTHWGQVATVLVVLPWISIFLVGLVLVIGLIYGVFKLTGLVPGAGKTVVDFLNNAKTRVKAGSDATTKPIISIQAWATRLNRLGDNLHPKSKQGKLK